MEELEPGCGSGGTIGISRGDTVEEVAEDSEYGLRKTPCTEG